MNSRTQKILAEFSAVHGKLYGEKFLFEIDHSSSPTKIVVMIERFASKLRDLLDNDPGIVVTSLDRDETVGNYYRVKEGYSGRLHHYYRNNEEWDRLLKDLDPSMITTERTLSGDHIVISELLAGEVFRGLETAKNPNWLAAAVCHDFEDIAPKQIGWVKMDSSIEQIPARILSRPSVLKALDSLIAEYAGTPYHLSGKSKEIGFDCSGLAQRIYYEVLGIWLPRLAAWQGQIGLSVKEDEANKMDLVICQERPGWKIEHVCLFINQDDSLPIVFHASRHNNGALIQDLNTVDWFKKDFKVSDYRQLAKK